MGLQRYKTARLQRSLNEYFLISKYFKNLLLRNLKLRKSFKQENGWIIVTITVIIITLIEMLLHARTCAKCFMYILCYPV